MEKGRNSFVYLRRRDLTLWQPRGINVHPKAPLGTRELSLTAIVGLGEGVLERKEQKVAKLALRQGEEQNHTRLGQHPRGFGFPLFAPHGQETEQPLSSGREAQVLGCDTPTYLPRRRVWECLLLSEAPRCVSLLSLQTGE